MKQIITTVGTSLFTNFQQEEVKNKYGRDYASVSIDAALKSITDKKPHAAGVYDDAFKHHIRDIRENIEDYWFAGEFPNNQRASAEIASIIEIAKEGPAEQFEVHLVATDTLLSVLAAEMIRDWFSKHKQLTPNVTEVLFQRTQPKYDSQKESDYVVKDLRVSDQKDYQQGFMNLIELLGRICKKGQSVLNITGGYKAIIPIMTLYGQLQEIPLKYLHDSDNQQNSTNELVSVGNLPVNFDFSIGELYIDHITKDGLKSISSYPDVLTYLREMSIVDQNQYRLTPLGRLFRDYIQPMKDKSKGELGHLIELRIMRHFVENTNFQVIRLGRIYWWDRSNPTIFTHNPQYDKDENKELAIEIDLILTQNDGNETWIEVKSWSKTGLKKAKDQIEKRIAFWQVTQVNRPSRFILLLYKLPSTPLDYERDQIRNIERLFLNESCVFTIQYIDIPISIKRLVNTKAFCENELELIDYQTLEQHG